MPRDVGELSLVGGHPALDLVNTLERGLPLDGEPPHDFLPDASALLRWTVRVGLISDAEAKRVGRAWRDDPAAAHAGLAAVRDVREWLHLAMLAVIPHANGGVAVTEATPRQVTVAADRGPGRPGRLHDGGPGRPPCDAGAR
jgi:hypothetical protein